MPWLDLGVRRDVGALLETAFRLWFRHFPVFFTLAFIVVAPFDLLVEGLWAGTLDEYAGDPGSVAATLADLAGTWVLVPALVTSMHVVAVEDVGRGERPTIRRSLAVAVRVFVPVVLVLVLYGLGIAVGLVLLVVPGVWLATRWYFGLQVAVIEHRRGGAALSRSAELVDGSWWRVFGITLLIGIVSALFGIPLGIVGAILHEAAGADTSAVFAVFQVLWNTLTISFAALATTLLYFDLRVRAGEGEQVRFAAGPERPQPA